MRVVIAMTVVLYGFAIGIGSPMAQEPQPGQIPPAVPSVTMPPEVHFIAAGIANLREQLKCAQASTTYYQLMPKGFNLPDVTVHGAGNNPPEEQKDREMTDRARWYMQDGKLSMIVEISDDLPNVIYHGVERMVADQERAVVLSAETNDFKNAQRPRSLQYQGIIFPPEEVLSQGIWRLNDTVDPRSYILFAGGVFQQPLDEWLLKSDPPPIYRGEETLYNSRCARIEIWAQHNIVHNILWFDLDHNFLLRRKQRYTKSASADKMILRDEWQMPQLLESNKIWFPAAVEIKVYWDATALTTDAQGIQKVPHPAIKRFTVSDFIVDVKAPPELFHIDWPVGTSVQDRLTGKNFTVLAVGPHQLDLLRKAQPVPPDTQQPTPPNAKATAPAAPTSSGATSPAQQK